MVDSPGGCNLRKRACYSSAYLNSSWDDAARRLNRLNTKVFVLRAAPVVQTKQHCCFLKLVRSNPKELKVFSPRKLLGTHSSCGVILWRKKPGCSCPVHEAPQKFFFRLPGSVRRSSVRSANCAAGWRSFRLRPRTLRCRVPSKT